MAELMWRITEVATQMTALAADLKTTYSRNDVLDGRLAVINGRIDTIASAQHQLRTDADAIVAQQLSARRMWISGLVFPVLAVIISAYLVASGVHP